MSAEPMPYHLPDSLEEALRALNESDATLMAGGTDLLPRWSKESLGKPRTIISLYRVREIRGISCTHRRVVIGAGTTMTEIAADPVILKHARPLAMASDHVACPQVRNRATIGGNLCNASPAADTAIPLFLLDAKLELAEWNQGRIMTREVEIGTFFQGPGATVRKPREVLTRISFPCPAQSWWMAWEKAGTRPAMEIAIASVGVALEQHDGIIADARVGFGSVAPIPMRGRTTESFLIGKALSDGMIQECTQLARDEIAPITDVRAGREYRREMVGTLLKRLLSEARERVAAEGRGADA